MNPFKQNWIAENRSTDVYNQSWMSKDKVKDTLQSWVHKE